MIEANELRIGNWVNIKVEGKDGTFDGNYQIEEIRKDVILFNNGIHAAYRMLYPIPLTEERLLKCGFERYSGVKMRKEGFGFIGQISGLFFYWSKRELEISSLHQLQNLYFALVGKELEVKL